MPRLPKDWTALNIKLSSELAQWIEDNRGQISKTDLIELAIALLRNESETAISGTSTAIEKLSAIGMEATPEGLRKIK